MIHTIKFNKLSAILLDFVDSYDGFLYLRIVGPETVVGAIWAKLSGKEGRGKKWSSEVSIPLAGQSYPQRVAAQKGVTYRTLRSRLPSGMVDLALVHPGLTVIEDSERGFYLLSYEPGVPAGFFERLNQSLSIPLKPVWAPWLWELGQQPQSFLSLETKREWEKGQPVERTQLVETTEMPISRLSSLGTVTCYTVHCQGRSRDAWLQIIRERLGLGIVLKKVPYSGGQRYLNDLWAACPTKEGWALHQGDEVVIQAPSLNHLLTEARESLGVYFILE